MKTIDNKFIIFNYNNHDNKENYEKDSNNGKTPWFYEPVAFNKGESYSIGFKTRKICSLVANIDECDLLLKINRTKLQKINNFFDELDELRKKGMINTSTKLDKDKLDLTFASNCYIIKKLESKIEELETRRSLLKNKLKEIRNP